MLSMKAVYILTNVALAALMYAGTVPHDSRMKPIAPVTDQGQPVHILRLENYVTFKGPICQAQMNDSKFASTTSPPIAHLLRIALETKSVIYLKVKDGDILQASLPASVTQGVPGLPPPDFQPVGGKDDLQSYDVEVRYLQASSNGVGYTAYVHFGGNLQPPQKPDVWIYTNYPIIGDVLELALKSGAKIQLSADGDGSIKKVHLPAQ
jgi:hypothetical protein